VSAWALALLVVAVRFIGGMAALIALTSNSPLHYPAIAAAPYPSRQVPLSERSAGVEQFVVTNTQSLASAPILNASRSIDERPLASAPFHFAGHGIDRERAANCLAAAAWYEAGDVPTGARAVIQVVLNRVRSGAYPNSVCGVVFQGSELATGCQFTFSCDGALIRRPSKEAWQRARALAHAALSGSVDATVGGATHYHANYVYPWWAPRLSKLTTVGPHVFYRFTGGRQFQHASQLVTTGPEMDVPKLNVALGIEDKQQETGNLQLQAVSDRIEVDAAGLIDRHEPIRTQWEQEGVIRFTADLKEPSGRWALKALQSCSGQRDCQAVGLYDVDQSTDAPTRHATPAFVFVRDSAAHAEIALWDCTRLVRTDKRDCLPADPAAVRRLLQMGQPPKPSLASGRKSQSSPTDSSAR
jgi:hypothetical protein